MKVVVARRVAQTKREILESQAFREWRHAVGEDDWTGTIEILNVALREGHIDTLTVILDGQPAILRPPSVNVQVQLDDGHHEPYALLMVREHDTLGTRVVTNPTTDVRWGESPRQAAYRVVQEATGLSMSQVQDGRLRSLVLPPVITCAGVTNEVTYLWAMKLVFGSHALTLYVEGLSAVANRHVVPMSRAKNFLVSRGPDVRTMMALLLAGG